MSSAEAKKNGRDHVHGVRPISATRTASASRSKESASLARDDDAKLVPPSRWMFINTKTEVSPHPSLAPPLLPQHR